MQVGPLVQELDLRQVAAPVVVVADVERLVDVLDEVDEEEERPRPVALGGVLVGQDRPKLLDLVDHALAVAAEPGVILRGAQRHVHVMPGAAPGLDVVSFVIGPVGDCREGIPFEKQVLHGRPGRWSQPGLGDPGRDPMPVTPPGQHGLARTEESPESERDEDPGQAESRSEHGQELHERSSERTGILCDTREYLPT